MAIGAAERTARDAARTLLPDGASIFASADAAEGITFLERRTAIFRGK
jgi:hypothetical protein